jgi:hypothetical protein
VTRGQRRTLTILTVALGLTLLISLGLLTWELYSVTLPDEASISEVVRLLYNEQPGAFMTVNVILAFGAGTLNGHWFWCKCPGGSR